MLARPARVPDEKTKNRGVVLPPAPQAARLPFTVVAKCTGLDKVPCSLRSPQVHLAAVMSLLKRVESLSDAAPSQAR